MSVEANPLLAEWTAPFGLPPYGRFAAADFRPAFDAALAAHRAELETIATDPAAPGFADTVDALELSGQALRRVGAVFFNLCSTDTSPELQAIERDIAPVLARHWNALYQDPRLFARLEAVAAAADPSLSAEQARVLERYLTAFRRSGAHLGEAERARLAAIAERLATLGTSFAQNLLADEQAYTLALDGEADLAGLPDFVRKAAASAAAERGLEGHVVTLARSSIEPFLVFSARRDLREAAFRAWIARGENGGATDNRAIVEETLALRAERARLLGFESFAHYRLDDSMAGSPEAALDLLHTVWPLARTKALADATALEAIVREEGGNFHLAPWDWRHYAEKRRRAEFDIPPGAVEPYFQLDRLIEAAFHVANRLFGITFAERSGLTLWHPDVRAFEVSDADGRHLGLFLGDYFARPSKRSGAWMSALRSQEKLGSQEKLAGDIRPIILNVMNFSKPAPGSPALLGFDDARTLFHEFGHALHGLLSDVTYPLLAGTAVDRDFVEFPSQLLENWLEEPALLERFARHHETGEPMPQDLVERLVAARNFDQGFATLEYAACAILDLELHLLESTEGLDIGAFEKDRLAALGMPDAIVMRHRPPQFAHLFSGGGYAAGYYSYLWSEVLDADGYAAFREAGDPFDPELGQKLRDHVLAAGNRTDPAEAYRAFRGRDPEAQALLVKRGLAA